MWPSRHARSAARTGSGWGLGACAIGANATGPAAAGPAWTGARRGRERSGGERQRLQGLDLARYPRHRRVQHARAEQTLGRAAEDAAEEAAAAADGHPRTQLDVAVELLDVVLDVDLDGSGCGQQET